MFAGARLSTLCLALGLAYPGQALALGLGDLHTDSRLGEVLQARIALQLGPREKITAECFGLVRPQGDLPWLKQGRFQIKGSELLLTGQGLLNEPILQVALRVDCGHDLRREYTLMPQPPLPGRAPGRIQPGQASATPAGALPPPEVTGDSRRIRAGDTPASIAAELYPDSRAEQRRFVQALIRSNRHLGLRAARGSRQSLPEGEWLSIPTLPPPAQVRPRPQAEAAATAPLAPATQLNLPALAHSDASAAGAQDRLVLASPGTPWPDAPLRLASQLEQLPEPEESSELLAQRRLFRLEYRMLAFLENRADNSPGSAQERLEQLEAALNEGRALAQPGSSSAIPPPATPAAAASAATVAEARPAASASRPGPRPAADHTGLWLIGAVLVAALGGSAYYLRRRQLARKTHAEDDEPDLAALIEPRGPQDPFDDLDHSRPGGFFAPQPAKRPGSAATSITADTAASSAAGLSAPHIAASHAARPPNVLDDLDMTHLESPAAGLGELPALNNPPSILNASVEEAFSHSPVMELADIMLSFGRVKGAAQALQEFIDQHPREALQPWVKLLEVYRMAEMRDEFDNLARSLNQQFNVELVRWSDVPGPLDPGGADFVLELAPLDAPIPSSTRAVSVEDLPHIRDRLIETWGTRPCLDYIQELLRDNREGTRQGFPIVVVEELLFLSELLREELEQAALAPDIELE